VADIKLWAKDLSFLLDQIEFGDPSYCHPICEVLYEDAKSDAYIRSFID
jgi:hypothetical protein